MALIKFLESHAFRLKTVAEIFGKTHEECAEAIQRGDLRAFRAGRGRRVPFAALEQYAQTLNATAA